MTKAVILTSQRSGSTFLVSCLQSHPDILCRGEMLITGGGATVPRVLQGRPPLPFALRSAVKLGRFVRSGAWNSTRTMRRFYQTEGPKALVFKAMYNHLSVPWTRRYLEQSREIRILHLRRENLLKQHVSCLLLTQSRDRKWQPHATEPVPPIRIHVSPQAALRDMRRVNALYTHFEHVFRDHQRLGLVYEQIIDGQVLRAPIAEAVCNFLGVPQRQLSSPLIKINPEKLSDMVINYDELADAVGRSEFAHLLDAA